MYGISSTDLLRPIPEVEAQKHKKKRFIPAPNSRFLDVKCKGCLNITTVFSHADSLVTCGDCGEVICIPTGGKVKLPEGVEFRVKTD